MPFSTFTELKSAALNWAERSDLSSNATDFVSLCDFRIRKALATIATRPREMETTTDLTPSSGVCTLPDDFMAMKRVQARTSAPRRLEYRTLDWLDEAYPDGASGIPAFYTVMGSTPGTTTLRMFPLTTSDIRITYYAYPAVLSDSTASNWLLAKYPDVYLYGTLVELEIFAGNDAGAQKWLGFFQGAIQALADSGFADSLTPGTGRTASGYSP